MLEPITIITAVVGIVAASTRLIPILATLANFQDAPKHAQDILLHVAGIKSIAEQLQAFIERRIEAPQVRQHLINVEHIQVILVECVTTYSELDPIMDSLGITPARGFWNRIKWKYKENDIDRILDRLGDHKLSLSLMLTILNGHSLLDAEASNTRLCNMVSQVLEKNQELATRLRDLEKISAAGQQAGPRSIDAQAFSPRVEADLSNSRVYLSMYSQVPVLRPDTTFAVNTAISIGQVPDICSISLPLSPKTISNAHGYTKESPSVCDTGLTQVLGQSISTNKNDNLSNLEANHSALRSTFQGNNINTPEVDTTESPNERRTYLRDTASGGSGTERSFGYPHHMSEPPVIHFSGLDSLEHIQASVNGRSYLIPKNGVPITIELYASEPLPRISRKVAQRMQSQVAVEDTRNIRLGMARHRHSVPAHGTPSFKHEDRTTGGLGSLANPDRENDPRLTRRISRRRRPRDINLSTGTIEVPSSRYDNPGYCTKDHMPRSCPPPFPPCLTIPNPKAAKLRPDPRPSLEQQANKKHERHQTEKDRPRLRRQSRMPENELIQRHDESASDSSDTDHDYTFRRHARWRSHSRGRRQFETPLPLYRESISRNRLTKRPPLITTDRSSSTRPHSNEPRDDPTAWYDQQPPLPSRKNSKPPVSKIWDPEHRWRQDSDTDQRQNRDQSRGRGVLRGFLERGKSLRSRSRLIMP